MKGGSGATTQNLSTVKFLPKLVNVQIYHLISVLSYFLFFGVGITLGMILTLSQRLLFQSPIGTILLLNIVIPSKHDNAKCDSRTNQFESSPPHWIGEISETP